ncbi:RNA polymerase II C-terminal domain phosphatase-like 4 isoform X1 [Silene latifolia]|uniref:RNA polymerase II C-terminal domain phosphatase-like 4 isoform X1 n=2 Tax=Silene latifolia TaxID=37657 RepID=UPI003D77E042
MAIALHSNNYAAMGGEIANSRRIFKRVKKKQDSVSCSHRRTWNDFCLHCGKKLRAHQINSTPYCKNLNRSCLSSISTSSSLEKSTNLRDGCDKKLCLVLDLDHTLVNSTAINDLSVDEQYLTSLDDAYRRGLIRLVRIGVLTKLRPFVRTFLSEASKMFELSIYTMGDRTYALEMAKLLDPENKYFDSRIISRDDCVGKHHKGLDVVKKPENSVLVLDDNESVWPQHKDNLILMDRYIYFSSSCRQFGCKAKSLSESKRDEDEMDGALSTTLQVLKRVHSDYVGSPLGKDVREILKNVRNRVLSECKVVFSGVFPRNFQASEHKLWKMAEELGATCCVDMESDVTHVVSNDGGTVKSRWAILEDKFLVNPRWIEATYLLWRRQLEDKFKVANDNQNNFINKFWYILKKDKLNGINFLDWYQALRIVLKIERKEYVIETPLPTKPEASAPQAIHDAFKRHTCHSSEVTCIMLLTMNFELQKQFLNMEAYDMIMQLKNLFQEKHNIERNGEKKH